MMRLWMRLLPAMPLAISALATPVPAAAQAPSGHAQLVSLFAEWRAFNHPMIAHGRPDYGAAAMSAKAAFETRLAAIDTTGWTAAQKGDYRLVDAEMNGLDFFLSVLRPWARDPGFYQTIFPEMSDVPAHTVPPTIIEDEMAEGPASR